MTKHLLIVILLLVVTPGVFAATATPSASPTETVEKIKNLVKESLTATEVDAQKAVLSKSVIGFTGKVKTVGTKNITIETDKDLLQILITESTDIVKGAIEIKTSAVAIGDNLLVYGQKNKDDIFEAKQIYVQPPVDEASIVISKAQIATINNIDLKKKTFTLSINGEDLQFTLSKKNTVILEEFKNGDNIFGITKKYQGKLSLSKAVKL